MKITRKQIRKIIKEALLLEEPADYYRDYRACNITRAEYEQLVKDFENRSSSRSYSNVPSTPAAPRKKSQAMIDLETEPIWKGTKKELEKKVHQYLIDIGFYLPSSTGYVNPFSQGDHPDGGYTSNIPGASPRAICRDISPHPPQLCHEGMAGGGVLTRLVL